MQGFLLLSMRHMEGRVLLRSGCLLVIYYCHLIDCWVRFCYINITHSWTPVTTIGISLKQSRSMRETHKTKCLFLNPSPLMDSFYFWLNAIMSTEMYDSSRVHCLFRTVTQAHPLTPSLCSSSLMFENSLTPNMIYTIFHVDRQLQTKFFPKYCNYWAIWLKKYKFSFYYPGSNVSSAYH